jgi:hypothetical protein
MVSISALSNASPTVPHRRLDPFERQVLGEPNRRILGGFKWSSQHLDLEVLDGTTTRLGGGRDGAAADAVAGAACGGAA